MSTQVIAAVHKGVAHFIDGQIVLYWLANGTKLRAYESRRVQQILDSDVTRDYRYVPTAANPADHCTKPLSFIQLQQSNYYEGPAFLKESFTEWPSWTGTMPDPRLLDGVPTSICPGFDSKLLSI